MKPLQRAEAPDFERFLKVVRREGGWCSGSGNSNPDYVPTESFGARLDEGLTYGR